MGTQTQDSKEERAKSAAENRAKRVSPIRQLSQYNFDDWRRLRPLTHTVKTLRYRLTDRLYMRRPPRAGDMPTMRQAIRDRKLLTTIAFSDPQAVDWQAQLVRRFVPDVVQLIADNSPDDASAAAVSAVAARRGLHYLRLPANPWHEPSRSHGIALNWVWQNIVLPGEPKAIGFLDDDIFPTEPDDPFANLATQDCYGVVRDAGLRWFLWAGFCFFRFAGVRHLGLDFGQDWFNGLDSGGGNWKALYRRIDRGNIREQQSLFVPFKPGIEVADGPYQWCGPWLHEVGLMGRAELAAEKRQATGLLLEGLLAHIEKAT